MLDTGTSSIRQQIQQCRPRHKLPWQTVSNDLSDYSIFDALRIFTNDTELIHSFHTGDSLAFETIYKEFARSVRFFVQQKVADKQVVEDITVETFTKAFLRNTDFPTLQQLKSFLFTTANNAALDFLKIRNRRDEIHEEISYLREYEMNDVELEYITAEATKALHAAIESLPERPRQVIRMAFVEGKKLPEIASELNISYNTVQVYRARGLDALRVQLIKSKLSLVVLMVALSMLVRQ